MDTDELPIAPIVSAENYWIQWARNTDKLSGNVKASSADSFNHNCADHASNYL
jgi:hypothetical protein